MDADSQAGNPLLWAAGSGGSANVELLLEAGADPNAMGPDETTALLMATATGTPPSPSLALSLPLPSLPPFPSLSYPLLPLPPPSPALCLPCPLLPLPSAMFYVA